MVTPGQPDLRGRRSAEERVGGRLAAGQHDLLPGGAAGDAVGAFDAVLGPAPLLLRSGPKARRRRSS